MAAFIHTLSDGLKLQVHLKRSAKKNIILRPVSAEAISVNAPPFLSLPKLAAWLQTNEPLLRQTLQRAPASSLAHLPDQIWYRGEATSILSHPYSTIRHEQGRLLLPDTLSPPQQKAALRRHLQECAAHTLLPLLQTHAQKLQLFPAATALSNAKTFWGVCRSRSGIRLNWRLIGAPDFVADYVCIHELCHLPHPNHSQQFWARVNRHTPHTAAAKQWFKQHGQALFVLD